MAPRVIAFDWTESERSFRRQRRFLGSVLVRISKRVYLGSLPKRTLESLEAQLRSKASKGSMVFLLVEDAAGYHGWSGTWIGTRPKTKILSTVQCFSKAAEFKYFFPCKNLQNNFSSGQNRGPKGS